MLVQGLAQIEGTEEDRKNLELNVAEYLETKNEIIIESIFKGVIKLIKNTRMKYLFIEDLDFYSDANLAMFNALRTYDSTKGCKFSTYYTNILLKIIYKRIRTSNTMMRAKDFDLLYLDSPAINSDEDVTLGESIPSKADMFNEVLVRHISNDVASSKRFTDLERLLFRYKFLDDRNLQYIVDQELYASKQSASRACIRLHKKLQIMYGGC